MKRRPMNLRQFRNTNYFISVDGLVFKKKRNGIYSELLLNDINGFLGVTLYYEGKRKGYMVHRLVAECFINEFTSKSYVSHIDKNKLNNNLKNLQLSAHPVLQYRYKVSNGITFEYFYTCQEIIDFLGYKQRCSITSLLKGGKSRTGYTVEKIKI